MCNVVFCSDVFVCGFFYDFLYVCFNLIYLGLCGVVIEILFNCKCGLTENYLVASGVVNEIFQLQAILQMRFFQLQAVL
jgi:hypothetical protein